MPMSPCPNASVPLPEELLESVLGSIGPENRRSEPREVIFHGEHSNEVVEVRFEDGRTLMVKRGRYTWANARFETARLAARLLREEAGIVAPAPLKIPMTRSELPIEVYWRVELPTLKEVWPAVEPEQQDDGLRSWGELTQRLHQVELPGHGPLPKAAEAPRALEDFLATDLGERLLPSVSWTWPAALPALERMIEEIPQVEARAAAAGGRLLHSDLHMGNVLCEVEGDSVECVGLLDLEASYAGPPEADLAAMEVLHGPLCAQPLHPGWFDSVREGYGDSLDPALLTFFRAYHLMNVGFHAAFVGHAEHAEAIARAAIAEVESLGSQFRARTAIAA